MRIVISLLFFLSMPLHAETTEQQAPAEKGSKATAETTVQVNKEQGKSIYEQYCVVCHENGVAGAPKSQDAEDWKMRLGKKDLDALTQSAIKGLNMMPAKGTCQTCAEEDIKAAIDYMVPSL